MGNKGSRKNSTNSHSECKHSDDDVRHFKMWYKSLCQASNVGDINKLLKKRKWLDIINNFQLKRYSRYSVLDSHITTNAVSTTLYKCLEALLAGGLNPNVVAGTNFSPLYVASSTGIKEIVKLLLDHGAEPNYGVHGDNVRYESHPCYFDNPTVDVGWSPPGGSCDYCKNTDKMSHDTNHKKVTNINNECNRVSETRVNGRLNLEDMAKIANELGVETVRECNPIPLIAASERGYLEIVKLLLDYGTFIDIQSHKDDSSLLDVYWDFGARPYAGHTALMQACREHHMDVVKELLSRGCNVNVQNDSGNTALHVACSQHYGTNVCGIGMIEIVQLLIENGAEMHVRNTTFHATPFELMLKKTKHMFTRYQSNDENLQKLFDIVFLFVKLDFRLDMFEPSERYQPSSFTECVSPSLVCVDICRTLCMMGSITEGYYLNFMCEFFNKVLPITCHSKQQLQDFIKEIEGKLHGNTTEKFVVYLKQMERCMFPLSLKYVSRFVIRKTLQEPFCTSVGHLLLPDQMKSFILGH